MSEADQPESDLDPLRNQLEQESGVISWAELARHFARGVVINVKAEVNIIDAAICLATDDKATLKGWLDSETLARASDDDARNWAACESEFVCVVTAPWVLVQEQSGGLQFH